MATGEVYSPDAFCQAVKKGSTEELKQLLYTVQPEDRNMAKIVNQFNSDGETPLLVAIKANQHKMVKILVEQLRANIGITGRFNWKGIEYVEALPIFAAILSGCTTDLTIIKCIVSGHFFTIQKGVPILAPFVNSHTIPWLQKVDMLDLMGAAYMLQPNEKGKVHF